MRSLFRRFLFRQKGVATVEFSLTFVLFALILVIFFDLAFLCVASAELDYIVALSTKYSKNHIIQGNNHSSGDVFNTYKEDATTVAQSLVSQITNGDDVLHLTLNSRVEVDVCPAKNFKAIIAQLESLASSRGGCKYIPASNSYYPYAVYQYRVSYKPFITEIPLLDDYTQALLTRRYVSLQEWLKTPSSEFKHYYN